jgi:diadenosine tetraphosphate (Ap4A) HIT family hydrolase
MAFHHPFPNPRYPVDTVVIPKKHVSSVMSPEAIDGILLKSMMTAVQKIAAALGIDNNGEDFYLQIYAESPGVTPHMHWHIRAPIPKE